MTTNCKNTDETLVEVLKTNKKTSVGGPKDVEYFP